MKNIVKIAAFSVVLFVIAFTTLLAQDILKPQPMTFLHSEIINDTINKFVFGWNWGSPGKKLDSALGMNFYHHYPENSTDYLDSMIVAQPIGNLVSGRPFNIPFNAQSLQIEPTINPDSTANFTPKVGDTTGAVFGFYNRKHVNLVVDPERVVLFHDSLPGSSPDTVLWNIWKGDCLRFLDYGATNNTVSDSIDKADFQIFNGKMLFLTINLHVLNTSEIASHLNDTILRIKLPYTMNHLDPTGDHLLLSTSTGIVKFDAIPDTSNSAIISDTAFTHNRGILRDTIGDTSQPTEFCITGRMIQFDTSLIPLTIDTSITLSAFAVFDNSQLVENPTIKNDWFENNFEIYDYINKFDVEVYYCGHLDIGIDYIRLETPRYRTMVWGGFDALAADTINDQIMTTLKNDSALHPILGRIYAADELTPQYWHTIRYFNNLINGLATQELYIKENPPYQYNYATGIDELWNGDNITHELTNYVAAPYIKSSNADYFENDQRSAESINLHYGFHGNSSSRVFDDTLHSQYELSLLRITDTSGYQYHLIDMPVVGTDTNFTAVGAWPPPYYILTGIQGLYDRFAWIFHNNQSFLYRDKNWWANMWVTTYTNTVTTKDSLFTISDRPQTGEETRLGINSCLSFGAKGLIYWFKTSDRTPDDLNGSLYCGLQPKLTSMQEAALPNDLGFILSDSLEGDFIKLHNDPFGIDSTMDSSVINFTALGIDPNRIYIGVKSIRFEMYNIHKFIRNNESTLMNLRLVSCWNKGLLTFYSQHPNFDTTSDTLLSNFIDFHNIKTRPIGRLNHSNPYYEQATSIDSGFYDITLHRDYVNDSSMSNSFYVCILNRRSDPLVFMDSTNEFEFYSTAEFAINTQNGGKTIAGDSLSAAEWQNLYWMRRGCREIKLPFKYRNPADTSKDYLLTITELNDSTDYNSNWWWYRKEKWNRKVDTIIGRDGNLTLNFLPGEARWFKINVSPKSKFDGELELSAQNKMVVYPIHQDSTKDFRYKDSANYYHLVYQKWDGDSTYNIYYRRSIPIYPTNKGTNIVWGPEYKISRTLKITHEVDSTITDTLYEHTGSQLYCKYPTIVVRYDSIAGEPMTYIVYNFTRPSLVDSQKVYIVETVFPANWVGIPDIPDTSKVIAFAYSGVNDPHAQENYGIPTINASYSGNYYAWADSLAGIVVGWKDPHDRGVITLKGSPMAPFYPLLRPLHPNLNTYSRMSIEENTCSLVWQGNQIGRNDIYYTRIKKVGSSIVPSIYSNRCDTTVWQFGLAQRSPDLKYAKLTDPYFSVNNFPCFPVIHKPVVYKLRACCENDDSIHYATAAWDRVSWMEQDSLNPSYNYNAISMKAIDIDDISTDTCMNFLPTSRIFSNEGKLLYPFLTQGNISNDESEFHNMVGVDSALILVFTERDTNGNSTIYQFNHDFWSLYHDMDTTWESRNLELHGDSVEQSYLHELGDGVYPHAASLPIVNNENDFWMTKTVYQTTDAKIEGPTEKLIYKGNYRQKKISVNFIGFSSRNNKNTSSITPFIFEDGRSLNINYGKIHENGELEIFDTLKSDWFRIGDIDKIGFNYFSVNGNAMKIYLESENDGELFDINQASTLWHVHRNKITLLNGHDENYRILIIKNDTSCMMEEQSILGYADEFLDKYSIRDEEQLLKASEYYSTSTILLHSDTIQPGKVNINIFPNPVDQSVFVTATLPKEAMTYQSGFLTYPNITIKLYSLIGELIYQTNATSGETININTSNIPVGSYFIRAEIVSDNNYIDPITKSLIIQR